MTHELESSLLEKKIIFQSEKVNIPEIFRNYRTILPPEDTFADLLSDEEERKVARSFSDAFSGIDLLEEVTSRPFQYALAFPEIKNDDFFRGFIVNSKTGNFPIGRFGDGLVYGVLYCAFEKETSEAEAIYYAVKEFFERKSDMKEELFIIDRKMVSFGFEGSWLNLLANKEIHSELTSENYRFCHEVGHEFHKVVDGLKAPSARSKDGICIPIFNKSSIKGFNQKDSFEYNFRITINQAKPEEIVIENFTTRIINTSTILR